MRIRMARFERTRISLLRRVTELIMTRKPESNLCGCSIGWATKSSFRSTWTVAARRYRRVCCEMPQKLAIRNVVLLKDVVTSDTPMVGIEPSAILGFRDEVPDLVPERLVEAANALAKHALLIDEFIAREADRSRIRREAFTQETRNIKLHGHCHQKSLASLTPTIKALELPLNYKVQVIPSGCCGMAGSFGYEKEHFDVSMKIGELGTPASCALRSGRHNHRGTRHKLPASDQRRHRAYRPAPGRDSARCLDVSSLSDFE